MKKLSAIFMLTLVLMLCLGARADTVFSLENGYELTLPDGWIADAPSAIAVRDVNAGERAIQTFYDRAEQGGGARIDVYVGHDDLLTDIDLNTFHARLRVHELLRDYFSSYTDSYCVLGHMMSDSGTALFMSYVYEPDDEYLMTFTFRDDAYTGFVFYYINDALDSTVPLSDADYEWFEGVMKSVRTQE